MTKVLVIGDGRMGTIIRELVEADESLELTGVIGIDNKDELADATPAADVAIDFSHKSMLDLVEAYVNRTGAALVSGTTGYDEAEMGRIHALGEKVPVIHSANYSLGVAVIAPSCRRGRKSAARFRYRNRRDPPQSEGRRTERHCETAALGRESRRRVRRSVRP